MPLFNVAAEVTISMTTVVEAKNAAEAKKVAAGQSMPSLCYQCSGGDPKETWITSGEFDGEPIVKDVYPYEDEEA